MSFKLGGIVIEDLNGILSAHEKLILACYASFAWKDGSRIWAAQATIAEMASCSSRMVRKALEKFLKDGVFVRVGKTHRTPEYRLVIERAIELYIAPGKAESGAAMSDGKAEHGSGSIEAPRSGKAEPGDRKAESGSGNPVESGMNPSAAAGGDGEKAPPPASEPDAHWRASLDALAKAVGEDVFKTYIKDVVQPVSDFGGRLTLAVPTRFLHGQLAAHIGTIEQVTGRKVEVIIRTSGDGTKAA